MLRSLSWLSLRKTRRENSKNLRMKKLMKKIMTQSMMKKHFPRKMSWKSY